MVAEAPVSLLNELRAATGESHARLDRKLALLEGTVDQERYATFLRGSLFALAPLEATLIDWAAPGASRSSLIRADLEALGCVVPVCAEQPGIAIERLAQAFGARYVIEGSALGGAVLARSFQNALGLRADCLNYLTLHGERLAAHWRAFLIELEAWGKTATPGMRREACETARAVFDLYERAFETAGALSTPS